MTRVASTDLLLKFTLGATSNPSPTEATAVIAKLYRDVYIIAYPLDLDAYSVDDSTDTENIVDVAAIFDIILEEASDLIDLWHDAGLDIPKPTITLSKNAIKKLKSAYGRKSGRITNIQLYGGDLDDVAW